MDITKGRKMAYLLGGFISGFVFYSIPAWIAWKKDRELRKTLLLLAAIINLIYVPMSMGSDAQYLSLIYLVLWVVLGMIAIKTSRKNYKNNKYKLSENRGVQESKFYNNDNRKHKNEGIKNQETNVAVDKLMLIDKRTGCDATHKTLVEQKLTLSERAKILAGLELDFYDTERSELGQRVHAELARYYDGASKMLRTDFKEPLARAISQHLERHPNMQTEVELMLLNERGICDLAVINGVHCEYLADFKIADNITGKYLEYCKMQLLLYRCALKEMGYDVSNTVMDIICPSGIIRISQSDAQSAAKRLNQTIVLPKDSRFVGQYVDDLDGWKGWQRFFENLQSNK